MGFAVERQIFINFVVALGAEKQEPPSEKLLPDRLLSFNTNQPLLFPLHGHATVQATVNVKNAEHYTKCSGMGVWHFWFNPSIEKLYIHMGPPEYGGTTKVEMFSLGGGDTEGWNRIEKLCGETIVEALAQRPPFPPMDNLWQPYKLTR